MQTVALVISIAALFVSIVSALYARQQARAARDANKIERERRLEETQPQLTPRIENMGDWDRMWLRIEYCVPLARLDAELVNGRGISFAHGVAGVDPSESSPVVRAFYGPDFLRPSKNAMHSGDAACWRIELEDDRTDTAQFRVTCQGVNGDTWTVLTELDMAST